MSTETASHRHRLDGLEPDNLLAFLALLGLLRTLDARDTAGAEGESLRARVAWDVELPPLRPVLHVRRAVTSAQVAECAAEGADLLAADFSFEGDGDSPQRDLNYASDRARRILCRAARDASAIQRGRVDLLASLMTDAAVKDTKESVVDPTPFCLLFGQGHQHFLERAASVPRMHAPASGKRKGATKTAAEVLREALFDQWHRRDATESFRWDPEEDVRYALLAGDPTDPAFKRGTQHGANRLAILGLPALTVVPEQRAGRVRPSVIGASFGRSGFSFAWPIWRDPASLVAIRALLAHPKLREAGGLHHLGVEHVVVARRISVGKFMNFSRARPLGNDRDSTGRRDRPRRQRDPSGVI